MFRLCIDIANPVPRGTGRNCRSARDSGDDDHLVHPRKPRVGVTGLRQLRGQCGGPGPGDPVFAVGFLFNDEEATTRGKYPKHLSIGRFGIVPVVPGLNSPNNRKGSIFEREALSRTN